MRRVSWVSWICFVFLVSGFAQQAPAPGIPTPTLGPGPFVIDTGTTIPILTMTGARRCGISPSLQPAPKGDTWGSEIDMKMATNVSLQLAPGFIVHWPKVLVHPGEDVTFGTLDYGTLKAGHAVIDIKQKTITMTK